MGRGRAEGAAAATEDAGATGVGTRVSESVGTAVGAGTAAARLAGAVGVGGVSGAAAFQTRRPRKASTTTPAATPRIRSPSRTAARRRARPASGRGAGVHGRSWALLALALAGLLGTLERFVDQAHEASPSSSRIAWRTARGRSS